MGLESCAGLLILASLGSRGTSGAAAPQAAAPQAAAPQAAAPQAAASYAHSGETAQLEEERKVSAGVSSSMPSLAVVSLTCVSKDFFKHLILLF